MNPMSLLTMSPDLLREATLRADAASARGSRIRDSLVKPMMRIVLGAGCVAALTSVGITIAFTFVIR